MKLFLLIAGVLLASARPVEACTCSGGDVSVPCELYGKAPVAFVGRVIEWPPRDGERPSAFVRGLKGIAGGELRVLNGDSGSGCGYQFAAGEEYLVFAARNKGGQVEIAPCSSSIWALGWGFDPAGAFVESLGRPSTGGRIYGEVELLPPVAGSPDPWWKKPVDGAIAILRSGGRERRVTTVKGRYEFLGLPPGVYNVRVSMPAGLPPARSTRIHEDDSALQARASPTFGFARASSQPSRPPRDVTPSKVVLFRRSQLIRKARPA